MAMSESVEKFLVDTDVLIDFLRQYEPAVRFVQNVPLPLRVSVISVAELYGGVRDGKERELLEQTLGACERVDVDNHAAVVGGLFRRDYGKSHGVGFADALIAATAKLHNFTLVTLNQKHYPMLDKVQVPYKKS